MLSGFLFKGLFLGLLVSVPLGPVGVMCIQRTINRGLKSGIVSGLGAAAADTFYAIIAGVGFGFIVSFINREKYWIQLIGAIVILAIAVKTFYTNPAVELRNQRNKKKKPMEEFLSVFFITLSNPVPFFVFLASFAGFNMMDENTNYLSGILLIGGIFTGAIAWWYILSLVISKFRSRIRLKNIWWLNKIMGVIIFICGLFVLYKLFF
jgi:threonine/homoserine/homoserine lactone efflux protein